MNGGLRCAHCDAADLSNAELVEHLAAEHDIKATGREARLDHTG